MSSTVFAKQLSRDYMNYGFGQQIDLAEPQINSLERTLNNMPGDILNEIQNAVHSAILKSTESEHKYMHSCGTWRERMKHDHTYMPVYLSEQAAASGSCL